jgi:hypothetical protein
MHDKGIDGRGRLAEDLAGAVFWRGEHMRGLEQFATGIQLADENLGVRPFRFLADENFNRLQQLRAKYAPHGLFHTYVGLPPACGAPQSIIAS